MLRRRLAHILLLSVSEINLKSSETTKRLMLLNRKVAMDANVRDELTGKLHRQREMLFREVADSEGDLNFIAEDRESELEERAQEELAARLLDRLSDRGKRQLEEIDAALERIATGAYGTCLACRKLISIARLRALPATRFCVNCAFTQEKQSPITWQEEEPKHARHVPAELSIMTDLELQTLIMDKLRDDGRVDLEELRVVCRHGIVYLDGALPSEAERSVVLQIVQDVIGIEEVVDRIQIQELLWERDDRSKAEEPEEKAPWVEPYGTEDIVESEEEGTDYVPPARPISEKD